MSEAAVGSFLIIFFVLLAAAHAFGYIFEKLHQPRVVGEIVAGVFVGGSVLGHFWPRFSGALFAQLNSSPTQAVHGSELLSLIYWLGLLLLMFASGTETQNLFSRHEQREVGWLAVIGTGLPFVLVMLASPWLPLDLMMGAAGQHTALLLVIGIAVSVTSIPVISRIFYDLKILHTRFARLVLGVAVIEDTVLWAALAIATALATSAVLPKAELVKHISATLAFFAAGLTIAPAVFQKFARARWNVLATSSPPGFVTLVLFTYCAFAARLHVSLVFAAFLAGFAVPVEGEFREALLATKRFAFAVFVPVYFAIVGFRLDLSKSFSLSMLVVVLAGACLLKLICVSLGARLAGFRGLDITNLAVATNARGGPGIVLASVAFDAKIVNATAYTTLVLLAVLTSQAAGAWLEYVLRRGWPLLAGVQEQPAAVFEPASATQDS